MFSGQPCSMAYTECCKNGEYSEDELQGVLTISINLLKLDI